MVTKKNTKIGKSKKVESEIKFGDLVDTVEKKKQAITFLMRGKNSDFWNFITQVLDLNIQVVENLILNEDELTDEERNTWRYKRYYMIKLRETPNTLLEELKNQLPNEEDLAKANFDPFD